MTSRQIKLFATTVTSTCLMFMASLANAGYYYESVTEGRTTGQRKGHYTKAQGCPGCEFTNRWKHLLSATASRFSTSWKRINTMSLHNSR